MFRNQDVFTSLGRLWFWNFSTLDCIGTVLFAFHVSVSFLKKTKITHLLEYRLKNRKKTGWRKRATEKETWILNLLQKNVFTLQPRKQLAPLQEDICSINAWTNLFMSILMGTTLSNLDMRKSAFFKKKSNCNCRLNVLNPIYTHKFLDYCYCSFFDEIKQ